MKVVIISDIHDNLVNLVKCLAWCRNNNIEKAICCGDITNSETLSKLSKEFLGDIFLVQGNAELYSEKELYDFENINNLGKIGRIRMENKNIGICHEPFLIEKVTEKGKCDYIFYGHTHKPWIEKKEDFYVVNPGTLGGVFQKASFAVLDLDKNNLELKVLENL